jgi:hypothetical protein
MTDVEIVARALCEQLNWNPDHKLRGSGKLVWTTKISSAAFLLRALTANGRAKIVRREPTPEMKDAAGSAFAAHGGAWGALCAAYDAAPAFSDQDKVVPVKTPERSS